MGEVEIIPPSKPVRLFSRPQPFATQCFECFAPPRLRVSEYVEIFRPSLPVGFERVGVVTIDDEIVPRELWRYVRPKERDGVVISFHMPIRDNVDMLTIAGFAVLIAATLVSAGALSPLLGAAFTAGGIGAKLAGLGIAIIGTLAIQALAPPPAVPALGPKASAPGGAVGTASLQGNLLGPGSPVPRVCGTMRVFPPLAMQPLVKIEKGQEVAEAVYVLAGDHDLSLPKLGEVLISSLSNTEYQAFEGDETSTTVTLVTQYGKTESVNQQLERTDVKQTDGRTIEDQANPLNSISKPLAMKSLSGPNEFRITIDFPIGLSMPQTPNQYSRIPIRVRFRRDGDQTWRSLPEFHFSGLKSEPMRRDIRIIFGNSPGLATPQQFRGATVAFTDIPMRLDYLLGDMATPLNAIDGDVTTFAAKASSADSWYGVSFHIDNGSLLKIPRTVNRVRVWPRTANGFGNTTNNITLDLYFKDGTAPANSTNGTIAQTIPITDAMTRTAPVVFTIADATHDHWWVRTRATAGGNLVNNVMAFEVFGDWGFSNYAEDRFRAANNVFDCHLEFSNVGSTNVRNINLNEDSVDIYLDTATYPADSYEFEIRRGFQYQASGLDMNTSTGLYVLNPPGGNTQSGIVIDLFSYVISHNGPGVATFMAAADYDLFAGEVSIPRYASVRDGTPVTSDAYAKMAVRTRQPADRFSVLASGKVQRWSGSAWNSYGPSQNPADHLYDIWNGPSNKRALTSNMRDAQTFVDFWNECNSKGYRINAVFEGRSVKEAARIAAGCGYAIERESDLFGVIVGRDRSAESVIQHFTSRNVKGQRTEKRFPDNLPCGFRVPFINEDANYQPDEEIVLRPGAVDTGIYEQANYEGLTKRDEVIERGIFDWRQTIYQSMTHHMESPAEWLKVVKGDTCALSFDIIADNAGSAYVDSVLTSGGNVTGLVLDGTIQTTGAAAMGVSIRCADGTNLVKQVTSAGQTRTITFTTPFANPGTGVLDQGVLVSSGVFSTLPRRAILNAADPKDGIHAGLVFIDDVSSILYAPPTVEFIGRQSVTSPTNPTHTFAAAAIGALSKNALLVLHTVCGGAGVSVSAVSLGGNACSAVVNTNGTAQPGDNRLWYIKRPDTGTTANILLTFAGGTGVRAHYALYAIHRAGKLAPYAAGSSIENASGTDVDVSIAIPRRGVAIVGAKFNGTNGVTWTNATERVDDANSTDRNTSGDFSNTSAAMAAHSFTAAQGASTTERRIAAASFR